MKSFDDCRNNRLVLSIDIGSSSVRCSAYNIALNEDDKLKKRLGYYRITNAVASYSSDTRVVQPISGCVLVDADDDGVRISLLEIVDHSIDACLKQLCGIYGDSTYSIIAVGFSTFVMNLVAVDHSGNLLGKDYTLSYACNTKSVAQEVKSIQVEIGNSESQSIYQMTGAPIHSAYALAQLRVLYRESDTMHISKWQTIASACLACWTGNTFLPISYSEASWTGLLNFRTCEYEPSIVSLLPENCRNHLPDLADYDFLDLRLKNNGAYWNRWSELRDTRFFLGLGDGACANIGSKCTTASRVACTVGTSAAARICLPLPVQTDSSTIDSFTVEPGLFCYRIDRSCILVGGALTDGGSVVEWIRQLLRLSSIHDFQQCLDEVKLLVEADSGTAGGDEISMKPSSSMTFAPFLSGERSTGFRSGATGAMIGFTRETRPAHIVKACLEGVTMRIGAILTLIQRIRQQQPSTAGTNIKIICSGRALEVNEVWRQMLADCTGVEVVLDTETKEGTSRGTAIMSLLAATRAADCSYEEEILPLLRNEEHISLAGDCLCRPRKEAQKYWEDAITAQESFIDAISPLYEC